jgi:hypothetical protein
VALLVVMLAKVLGINSVFFAPSSRKFLFGGGGGITDVVPLHCGFRHAKVLMFLVYIAGQVDSYTEEELEEQN